MKWNLEISSKGEIGFQVVVMLRNKGNCQRNMIRGRRRDLDKKERGKKIILKVKFSKLALLEQVPS